MSALVRDVLVCGCERYEKEQTLRPQEIHSQGKNFKFQAPLYHIRKNALVYSCIFIHLTGFLSPCCMAGIGISYSVLFA